MKIALNSEQKSAIINAIKRNEAKTSGEIYCVIARKSEDYRWFVMIWAIVLALLVPFTFAILNIDLGEKFANIMGSWDNYDNAINSRNLFIDLIIQALIFLVFGILVQFENFTLALTPKFIKRQGVHKSALDQFMAHGIHQTKGKTGVLVFVSLAEHMIEVVADGGIHSKVKKTIWGDAIAKMLLKTKQGQLGDGLADGIDDIGAILAEHFPPDEDDVNELTDSVVFI